MSIRGPLKRAEGVGGTLMNVLFKFFSLLEGGGVSPSKFFQVLFKFFSLIDLRPLCFLMLLDNGT